jgi:hypothetical protein
LLVLTSVRGGHNTRRAQHKGQTWSLLSHKKDLFQVDLYMTEYRGETFFGYKPRDEDVI